VSGSSQDNWDQHWEQFAQSAELGPTPRYRRRIVRSLFDFRPPGESVRFLEIGSGTGEFAKEFCESFPAADYLGLELSQTGVSISRQRVPQAQFLQRDLLKDAAQSDRIDYGATHGLCSEVLEHVDDPSILLRNAAAYCSPGCRLVITVPGGPASAFSRHIGHRRHYKPAEIASLLEQSGFEVETALGVGFPFFNLFQLLVTLRGPRFIGDVSGRPSAAVRIGSRLFAALFRLNSRRFGWQTIAIARHGGATPAR
jgi:SAM-dependent methyltransferase